MELPQTMQRAMARQAEAEREKRAKIIHAEGEFEASQMLAEAAEVIGTEPATIQLRYLQTLTEIAAEKNSTIIFPVPIELLALISRIGSSLNGKVDGTGTPPPPRESRPEVPAPAPETARLWQAPRRRRAAPTRLRAAPPGRWPRCAAALICRLNKVACRSGFPTVSAGDPAFW